MPDLSFKVHKVEPAPYAAAPLLNFTLGLSNAEPGMVHAVALRCQIQIEPARRKYQPAEQERLRDLFGEPARWGQTLRTMLWAHAAVVVPPFSGTTSVDMPVPCTYDFNIAATKFFYALELDEAPLRLQFSGTVFYAGPDDAMQIAQISWEKETTCRLPVAVWKKMMELYYPNSAWLCLRKDAFDRLYQYKIRHALPTWEAAIERLLAPADEEVAT